MAITVTCHCGKKLQARDEHAGMRAKCPTCGAVLLVPRPKPPSPPAASGVSFAAGDTVVAGSPTADTISRALSLPAAPATPKRLLYEGKPVSDWLKLLSVGDAAARRQASEALAKVGPEAQSEIPLLIVALESEQVLERHWAIACLKQIGPLAAAAVEPLLARLADSQPLLREEAARALAVVVPGGDRFLPRVLKALNDKKAEAREGAVNCFRRDLRTAGISRRRFWMCSCGSVFEKDDLERQLMALGNDDSPVAFNGERKCKRCGKQYAVADVYAGKHDVPEKYRAKLAARYGERVDLPDDLLADVPAEALGYQVHEGPTIADTGDSHSSTQYSIQLPGPAAGDATEGYALSTEPAYRPDLSKREEFEPAEVNLAPGDTVPTTGKYRCTSCGKLRLSDSLVGRSPGASGIAKAAEAKPTYFKSFKAGRQFGKCPNCRDMTEWELVADE
jgi:hypothetical protein